MDYLEGVRDGAGVTGVFKRLQVSCKSANRRC